MKKIWVYLLGVLTGIIFAFLVLIIVSAAIKSKENIEIKTETETKIEILPGMRLFDKPGEEINETGFKVFQSLTDGFALASGKGDAYSEDLYMGLTVLLYSEEGNPYYDAQVIKAPEGKCFKQVGIYKYTANSGMVRTVPVVQLMDD